MWGSFDSAIPSLREGMAALRMTVVGEFHMVDRVFWPRSREWNFYALFISGRT